LSEDPRFALLVKEMHERHGCHTVVLYGSRARGDFREDSDYDVVGVRDHGKATRDARVWEGAFLDAFIYPAIDLIVLEPGLARLAGGLVLCDWDGMGSDLVERATELASEPVEALEAAERQVREVWFDKMLVRARADDVEAHYRRIWLLYQLLEDYFALRQLPYRGPKESFAWLLVNDVEAELAFREALTPGAPLSVIEALVKKVSNAKAIGA
jgi:predicted nucleotidyltransferase